MCHRMTLRKWITIRHRLSTKVILWMSKILCVGFLMRWKIILGVSCTKWVRKGEGIASCRVVRGTKRIGLIRRKIIVNCWISVGRSRLRTRRVVLARKIITLILRRLTRRIAVILSKSVTLGEEEELAVSWLVLFWDAPSWLIPLLSDGVDLLAVPVRSYSFSSKV